MDENKDEERSSGQLGAHGSSEERSSGSGERGFGAMDPEQQRRMASPAGQADSDSESEEGDEQQRFAGDSEGGTSGLGGTSGRSGGSTSGGDSRGGSGNR